MKRLIDRHKDRLRRQTTKAADTGPSRLYVVQHVSVLDQEDEQLLDAIKLVAPQALDVMFEALQFYADRETYRGFMSLRGQSPFDADHSFDEQALRPVPGSKARQAILKLKEIMVQALAYQQVTEDQT